MGDQIKKHNYLLVVLLYVLAEIAINPIGEFPLNDDWSYSKTIFEFIQDGKLKFSAWQAIPLVSQYALAIPFCKIFGFSFTLLRLITISAGIVNIVVLSSLLKNKVHDKIFHFVILLCFAFSPLSFSLSNTFLPDVFLLMFSLIGYHYLNRYMLGLKTTDYVLFCFFCVAATLVRQTGAFLPLAFLLINVTIIPKTFKKVLLVVFPFLFCFLALWVFEIFASEFWDVQGSLNYQFKFVLLELMNPSINLVKSIFYYSITSSIALGVFLLPLTVSNFKGHFEQLKQALCLKILACIYLILVLVKIFFSENILPFVGNLFYHIGIGPIFLNGFISQDIPTLTIGWKIFWWSLNLLGGFSFASFILVVVTKIKGNGIKSLNLYFTILAFCIIYFSSLCLSYFNDRYLLQLLPLVFLLYLLSFDSKIKILPFLLVFIPLTFYSIAGTHDYLNLNRARWEATNNLIIKNKVAPNHIDGGFEFNGWHFFGLSRYHQGHTGKWWWVQNDTYLISTIPKDNYTIVARYPFSRWISANFNEILVLRKN